MDCCYYHQQEGCDSAFIVDASRITFDCGYLREIGDRAVRLGMKRVALFTDARVVALPMFETVVKSFGGGRCRCGDLRRRSRRTHGCLVQEAAQVAREIAADGYASLGGGATESDAGIVLAGRLIEIMRGMRLPNGLSGVGYVEGDLEALTDAAVHA